MANGQGESVDVWVEVGMWLLSGVASLFAILMGIVWKTKPNHEQVQAMIDKANEGIAAAAGIARTQMEGNFARELDHVRELTKTQLEAIREGLEYNNRALDEIKAMIQGRPVRR